MRARALRTHSSSPSRGACARSDPRPPALHGVCACAPALEARQGRPLPPLDNRRVTKEGGETDLSTAVSQAAQEAAKDEL